MIDLSHGNREFSLISERGSSLTEPADEARAREGFTRSLRGKYIS